MIGPLRAVSWIGAAGVLALAALIGISLLRSDFTETDLADSADAVLIGGGLAVEPQPGERLALRKRATG